MIPKIIHYCWFGNNPKPKNALKCIDSWKKYCPDFEIREWTEKDFDVNQNEYTRQAYEAKAWGFVPDYIRLWIIYNHGGFYLDTDVQVVRDLSPLCKYSAFAGLQDIGCVALGLGFGAEAGNPIIKAHMQQYEQLRFVNEDGIYNKTPSPDYTTKLLLSFGFDLQSDAIQDLGNITIFPKEYFCPKDFATGITRLTPDSYSIHQFDASWYTEEQQKKKKKQWQSSRRKDTLHRLLHIPNQLLLSILGQDQYRKLKHFFRKG